MLSKEKSDIVKKIKFTVDPQFNYDTIGDMFDDNQEQGNEESCNDNRNPHPIKLKESSPVKEFQIDSTIELKINAEEDKTSELNLVTEVVYETASKTYDNRVILN